MPILGRKKEVKKWKPVRQEKTAEQRKQQELYGRTIVECGVGKKRDGSLMGAGADWKNL